LEQSGRDELFTIAKHKVVGSKPITRSIQILSSQFKIVPRARKAESALACFTVDCASSLCRSAAIVAAASAC
jgi:hypothetical protein